MGVPCFRVLRVGSLVAVVAINAVPSPVPPTGVSACWCQAAATTLTLLMKSPRKTLAYYAPLLARLNGSDRQSISISPCCGYCVVSYQLIACL